MDLKRLPDRFFDQCLATPTELAFFYYDQKEKMWTEMSWAEYGKQVQRVAGWLRANGIDKGDKVAILSANRPEWVIADLAILSLGAISVPIYATSSSTDVQFILEHSEAKYLFVDTAQRAKAAAENHLQGVILFDEGAARENAAQVYRNWTEIMSSSVELLAEPVAVDTDSVATIIYTSGTTGRPKGVVHTHNNFCEAMKVVVPILTAGAPANGDRFFSFLPLSHVAERVLIQLGSIYSGSEVAFARSVSTLAEDLVRCRPTILLCVPRLWEKMYEKICAASTRSPLSKRLVFHLARRFGQVRVVGQKAYRSRNAHVFAILSDMLLGKALRKKLGLDRARILLTGSAPTRPEVMKFFASFGLFIREVYGLTENLCLGVLNDNDLVVVGSCGKSFDLNEIKLADDNEIMFRAPWLFSGYYKDEEATRAVLTADGWFATGDLGSIDEDGYLRIVGRKKELLKTSTGKYVAPVPIEDRIKELPLVADAMVVGDNQKYCIAVVAIDGRSNAEEIEQHLADHLKLVNQNLANHESVKRIGILERGFSVEDGTLTPTLKLKRQVAVKKHAAFIEQIYLASDTVIFQSKH